MHGSIATSDAVSRCASFKRHPQTHHRIRLYRVEVIGELADRHLRGGLAPYHNLPIRQRHLIAQAKPTRKVLMPHVLVVTPAAHFRMLGDVLQYRAPVVAVLFRVPFSLFSRDNDPQRRALIDAGFGMRLYELDQGRPDAAMTEHERFVQPSAQGAALRRSVLLTISTVARDIAQRMSAAVYSLMTVLRMVKVRSAHNSISSRAMLWCIRISLLCEVASYRPVFRIAGRISAVTFLRNRCGREPFFTASRQRSVNVYRPESLMTLVWRS